MVKILRSQHTSLQRDQLLLFPRIISFAPLLRYIPMKRTYKMLDIRLEMHSMLYKDQTWSNIFYSARTYSSVIFCKKVTKRENYRKALTEGYEEPWWHLSGALPSLIFLNTVPHLMWYIIYFVIYFIILSYNRARFSLLSGALPSLIFLNTVRNIVYFIIYYI